MANWDDLPQEIVDFIEEEVYYKNMLEKEEVNNWRYAIVKDMDVMAFYPDWDRDMPCGFYFNRDEDREVCGWYWLNDEPFMGADAIASFLLRNAQRKVDDFWLSEYMRSGPFY